MNDAASTSKVRVAYSERIAQPCGRPHLTAATGQSVSPRSWGRAAPEGAVVHEHEEGARPPPHDSWK